MFGELIVGYLFLAGVGAGACFVLAALGLCVPRPFLTASHDLRYAGYRRGSLFIPDPYGMLFTPAYAVAIALLVLGAVCLLLHLGNADRLVLLITQPRLSYITIGAYALLACLILSFAVLLVWRRALRPSVSVLRVMLVASAFASVVVMVYTGFFLASMKAVPLWDTALLPVLFLLSSVSCGIGVVTLVSQLSSAGMAFSSTMRRLVLADVITVALEIAAILVVGYLFAGVIEQALALSSSAAEGEAVVLDLTLLNNTQLALLESVWQIAVGDYSLVFWLGLMIVGLIAPIILDIVYYRMRRPRRGVILASAICLLVGGFALRYCVVMAGVRPALIMTGVM